MNISIIGTGYVGLVCGACFAEMGNKVLCVDTDEDKIRALNKSVISIYEPGLDELVKQNLEAQSLFFSAKIQDALSFADVCFIAVSTPMNEDGSADSSRVLAVAETIGRHMTRHTYIVNKSTVPVGTAELVREAVNKQLRVRGVELTFDVISNPEFLKEAAALDDFMKPDRIVVGVDNDGALKIMRELYSAFAKKHDKMMVMDVKSAEMTKYAANAMLATKISFINEVANICERVGADVNKVRQGIGSDPRIGYDFIYPGCGYGGSCFPKDVRALIRSAEKTGYVPGLLRAVDAVNQRQKLVLADKVIHRLGHELAGQNLAVWGLSFKPGTDDMREAPATTIIKRLTARGARIRAYDPKAMEAARNHHLKGNQLVDYFPSKYEAVRAADALLIVTEWKEFRSPDFEEIRRSMKRPLIFDGRNQYDRARMAEAGFEYYQIGVGEKAR